MGWRKVKVADRPRRWLIHSSATTQRSIQTVPETDSLLQEHNASDKISPNIPDMQFRQRRRGKGGFHYRSGLQIARRKIGTSLVTFRAFAAQVTSVVKARTRSNGDWSLSPNANFYLGLSPPEIEGIIIQALVATGNSHWLLTLPFHFCKVVTLVGSD